MTIPVYSYENTRRVVYAEDGPGGAQFVPVCPVCGRYVRADARACFDRDGQPVGPNATCSRCGRVEMPFEGHV